MTFIATCKIDDGARIYTRISVVKAANKENAITALKRYYASGYDETCNVLDIKEYNFCNGVVLEVPQ